MSKPVLGLTYGTRGVTCCGCGQPMRFVGPVAIAHHTHVTDTVHTRWECDTPDCGGSLVVEDDYK